MMRTSLKVLIVYQDRAGVSAVAIVAWQLQIFGKDTLAILNILPIIVAVDYMTNSI